VHAVSDTLFQTEGAQVRTRWGSLPAGTTIDPGIEPAREPSFILDLDMFSTAPMPFDVVQVVTEAERFAERLYTIFRWAVTDRFLARYGGTP